MWGFFEATLATFLGLAVMLLIFCIGIKPMVESQERKRAYREQHRFDDANARANVKRAIEKRYADVKRGGVQNTIARQGGVLGYLLEGYRPEKVRTIEYVLWRLLLYKRLPSRSILWEGVYDYRRKLGDDSSYFAFVREDFENIGRDLEPKTAKAVDEFIAYARKMGVWGYLEGDAERILIRCTPAIPKGSYHGVIAVEVAKKGEKRVWWRKG